MRSTAATPASPGARVPPQLPPVSQPAVSSNGRRSPVAISGPLVVDPTVTQARRAGNLATGTPVAKLEMFHSKSAAPYALATDSPLQSLGTTSPNAKGLHRETGAGYSAFERSVRRVLTRSGQVEAIDDTWHKLSAWIDKYFVGHDTVQLANDAERVIDSMPSPNSAQAPVRLNTACTLLDDVLSLATQQYRTLATPVSWAREELFTWLFVDPAGPIAANRSSAPRVGRGADTPFDASRCITYGAKTYRQVLRHAAARLPDPTIVEFSEKIKETMGAMMFQRAREVSNKFVGICFRLWRRHCLFRRTRRYSLSHHPSGRGISSVDDPQLSGYHGAPALPEGLRSSSNSKLTTPKAAAANTVASPQVGVAEALREAQSLELGFARQRVADLEQHNERLREEMNALQQQQPAGSSTQIRAALASATSTAMKLQEVEASLSGALRLPVYPPPGFDPSRVSTMSASDFASTWLRQYGSKTGDPIDFADSTSVVSAYAHSLHARCPVIMTAARLNAVVLPRSFAIRRQQLVRLLEANFAVDGMQLLQAINSGTFAAHVPVVLQLIVASQRRMRTPPSAEHFDVQLEQQLSYVGVLEQMLVTAMAPANTNSSSIMETNNRVPSHGGADETPGQDLTRSTQPTPSQGTTPQGGDSSGAFRQEGLGTL